MVQTVCLALILLFAGITLLSVLILIIYLFTLIRKTLKEPEKEYERKETTK